MAAITRAPGRLVLSEVIVGSDPSGLSDPSPLTGLGVPERSPRSRSVGVRGHRPSRSGAPQPAQARIAVDTTEGVGAPVPEHRPPCNRRGAVAPRWCLGGQTRRAGRDARGAPRGCPLQSVLVRRAARGDSPRRRLGQSGAGSGPRLRDLVSSSARSFPPVHPVDTIALTMLPEP